MFGSMIWIRALCLLSQHTIYIAFSTSGTSDVQDLKCVFNSILWDHIFLFYFVWSEVWTRAFCLQHTAYKISATLALIEI